MVVAASPSTSSASCYSVVWLVTGGCWVVAAALAGALIRWGGDVAVGWVTPSFTSPLGQGTLERGGAI